MELIEVPAGLAGVAVTTTSVGDVLGDEGLYHYRGRSAVALATSSTFEEAAALVLDGSGRPAVGDGTLPEAVAATVATLGGALDLRSALSLLGAAVEARPLSDLDPDERRAAAVRMISCFPALVASVHHGSVRTPRADLGHIANYLWMLTGSEDPEVARALEVYCTLTIDHGFNSGTFAARVIASTAADVGACVLGAYSALTGPRHGAVQSRVLDMLDEMASSGDAEAWMRQALASRRRILGFGHAVYRVLDPRAPVLRELTARLAPERHQVAVAAEQAAATVLAGRRIAPNVDLYSPVLLEACGIPPGLFTATFAVARVVGWCAHILEQAAEPKVIRPAAYYVGPPPEIG
ncbi:MAG: citrate/2-methylcitrate synthase [Acidimicrobiia bacterium]